jgi:predicted membrane channel-forming protein YqfA (hemolysin III family)
MSTQIETDTLERSPTVNSKWWYWIAAQPIMIVLIIAAGVLELGVLALLLLLASAVVYLIGLFAYAADIKAIDKADGINWSPNLLVYINFASFFGMLYCWL